LPQRHRAHREKQKYKYGLKKWIAAEKADNGIK